MDPSAVPPSDHADGASVGRAWVSVALIPVFFIVALAVGYLTYDLLGYKPENDDAPLWADVVVAAAVLIPLWIPCGAAISFGRQATRAGDRRGFVPLALGVVAGVGFTTLSLVDVLAT